MRNRQPLLNASHAPQKAGDDCYNIGIARDEQGRLFIRYVHRLGAVRATSDGPVREWRQGSSRAACKLLAELLEEPRVAAKGKRSRPVR